MNKNNKNIIYVISVLLIVVLGGFLYYNFGMTDKMYEGLSGSDENSKIAESKSIIMDSIEGKSLSEGLVILENQQKEDPKNFIIATEIAMLKKNIENDPLNNYSKELIEEITIAYNYNPEYYKTNTEMGKIAMQNGEFSKAIEYFNVAILNGGPLNTEPIALKGISLVNVGKQKEGAEHLVDALERHENNLLWKYELGRAYYELGKFNDAKVQLQFVIENSNADYYVLEDVNNLMQAMNNN